MNMNKIFIKILTLFILLISIFTFTNVKAYESCAYVPSSKCNSTSVNGFKCESKKGACVKSNKEADTEPAKVYKSCSEYTGTSECNDSLLGCIWRQNACYPSTNSSSETPEVNLFSNDSNNNNTKKDTKVSCSSLKNETSCGYYPKCTWNKSSGSCSEQYVAESPCTEQRILLVIRFFGYLLLLAKVAIPLIIIGFGTFDLLKSVISKDEKTLGKQVKVLLIRIAVGIFIFFIPALVNVIFNLSPKTKFKSDYNACKNCLLTPTKCSVKTLETTKD